MKIFKVWSIFSLLAVATVALVAHSYEITSDGKKMVVLEVVSHSGDTTQYPDHYVAYTRVPMPDPVPRDGYAFGGWFDNPEFTGHSVQEIYRGIYEDDDEVFTYYAKWWPLPKREGDCYKITSAGEMFGFAAIVNGAVGVQKDSAACAELAADIEFGEELWVPIRDFAGSIDGKGFVLSGIKIEKDTDTSAAVFIESINGGSIEHPVSIKNVGWVNSSIRFANQIGLIYKIKPGSHVELDHVFNTMNMGSYSGAFKIGAFQSSIVGYVEEGAFLSVTNSYNAGNLCYDPDKREQGKGYFIFVARGKVFIKNFYNLGAVGELIYAAHDSMWIENAYNLPEKQLYNTGLIGAASDSNKIVIVNSYFIDSLTSKFGGTKATAEEFADGTVAMKLHHARGGDIWGQNVGTDVSPVFSGEIVGQTGSSVKVSSLKFVTFDGDTTKYSADYVEGTVQHFVEPPYREGFVFGGWFDNEKFVGNAFESIPDTATGDLTFYGKWSPLPKLKDGCYELGSAGEMFGFAAIVNGAPGVKKDSLACAKLVADIEFAREVRNGNTLLERWDPIDNFAGNFDGNGHTITNINPKTPYSYYESGSRPTGLFGSVTGGTPQKPIVIKNLNIRGGVVSGSWQTGTIVGNITRAHVVMDSISVDGSVWGAHIVGGLVGQIEYSTVSISNSSKVYVENNVYQSEGVGSGYVAGGLVGGVYDCDRVDIVNSFVKGDIWVNDIGAGLILSAVSDTKLTLKQVYGEGKVQAYSHLGGFIGSAYGGEIFIENAYVVGDIESYSTTQYITAEGTGVFMGGFIGIRRSPVHLVNSYHLGSERAECIVSYVGAIFGKSLRDGIHMDNVYYLSSPYANVGADAQDHMFTPATDVTANEADSAMFADGSVAFALHSYNNGSVNGDIWGQKVGTDPYPVFVSGIDGFDNGGKFSKLVLHTFDGDTMKYANAYMEGVTTALPLPVREGHYFRGWFSNSDFTGDTVYFIGPAATGEQEYYAKFEIEKFNLEADIMEYDCSGKVEGLGNYEYGSKVVLKAIPDSGCVLGYTNPQFSDEGLLVIEKVTKSVNAEVHFKQAPYSSSSVKSSSSSSEMSSSSSAPESSSSSVKPASSSSEKSSSSSVKSSSSSSVKSSSSSVKSSSSSSVKSSSSSAPKSSSSSAKPASSSSSEKMFAMAWVYNPALTVNVMARNVHIDGAEVGKTYALLDMQGRVLLSGRFASPHVDFRVPRPGIYLVKTGGSLKRIEIK